MKLGSETLIVRRKVSSPHEGILLTLGNSTMDKSFNLDLLENLGVT